jgi:hypothetical protein
MSLAEFVAADYLILCLVMWHGMAAFDLSCWKPSDCKSWNRPAPAWGKGRGPGVLDPAALPAARSALGRAMTTDGTILAARPWRVPFRAL